MDKGPAEVLFGINSIYTVRVGGVTMRCRIKGKILRTAERAYNPIAPGDLVAVAPDPLSPSAGLITGLVPRRTSLRRWNKKSRAAQVIAANADLAVCVCSGCSPPFRPRFIDRLAAAAEDGGMEVLVLVNKADLGVPEDAEDRLADYARLGYGTLACSATTGQGIEELRGRLAGRTAVFVGQSGVGKSSVLNSLAPGLGLRIGEISTKHERGSHTTTHAVLLATDELRVIDTPGIRELELADVAPGELAFRFREFAPIAGCCSVAACLHEEEPGCAVRTAAESGAIHPDRYESYRRILSELREAQGQLRG